MNLHRQEALEMSQMLTLLDFSTPEPVKEQVVTANDRDEAYEKGFADGQSSASAGQAGVDAAFVAALEGFSFTYAEARNDILAQLKPLLQAISAQLVPEVVGASLQARLLETLQGLADDAISANVNLTVNPTRHEDIKSFLTEQDLEHVTVKPDASLPEGTAKISGRGSEFSIDIAQIATQFADAVSGFATQIEDIADHG